MNNNTDITIIERKHDLREEDIPVDSRIVACDTETTGLDWRTSRLCTCQFWFGQANVFVVRSDNSVPSVISRLIENKRITKVFHHAPFDLRFMVSQWGVKPANIICTKIASKLLDIESQQNHSLRHLLSTKLGVKIDKSPRLSDWSAEKLSSEQIRYAANDVLYLLALIDHLQAKLKAKKLWMLAKACFCHIPTRVQLDVMGYKDVFEY